jgi:hypothetical protein
VSPAVSCTMWGATPAPMMAVDGCRSRAVASVVTTDKESSVSHGVSVSTSSWYQLSKSIRAGLGDEVVPTPDGGRC